jgi:hypothetical protein
MKTNGQGLASSYSTPDSDEGACAHRELCCVPACRYENAKGFWDCAQQIEEWAGAGYSKVLWYLVSDSRHLRCWAAADVVETSA